MVNKKCACDTVQTLGGYSLTFCDQHKPKEIREYEENKSKIRRGKLA